VNKLIKIVMVFLVFATFLTCLMYVSAYTAYVQVDYTTGTYITLSRLNEKPEEVPIVTIENDTYVQEAINDEERMSYLPDFVKTPDGQWVWRPEFYGRSEWESKGMPEYIFWVPDGYYYFVSITFNDGIPEFFKHLPPPTTAIVSLAIPWTVFLAVLRFKKK